MSSILALVLLVQVLFLYQTPTLLFISLALYNGIILYIEKSKTLFKVFIFAGIFGPISEILAVMFGVWTYSVSPSMFGVPFWLVFVWGHAGIYLYKFGLHVNKK